MVANQGGLLSIVRQLALVNGHPSTGVRSLSSAGYRPTNGK